MSYAVAVDIGGTCTDLVAFDHRPGSVAYAWLWALKKGFFNALTP